MKILSLGYSPCPNDTFIFYALVDGRIDLGDLHFARPHLEDVETLNIWALQRRLDVTKISCHALGHVLATTACSRPAAPWAVVAAPCWWRHPTCRLQPCRQKVAIPGRLTTASLLFRLFLPACSELVEMRFDRIMEAVAAGDRRRGDHP